MSHSPDNKEQPLSRWDKWDNWYSKANKAADKIMKRGIAIAFSAIIVMTVIMGFVIPAIEKGQDDKTREKLEKIVAIIETSRDELGNYPVSLSKDKLPEELSYVSYGKQFCVSLQTNTEAKTIGYHSEYGFGNNANYCPAPVINTDEGFYEFKVGEETKFSKVVELRSDQTGPGGSPADHIVRLNPEPLDFYGDKTRVLDYQIHGAGIEEGSKVLVTFMAKSTQAGDVTVKIASGDADNPFMYDPVYEEDIHVAGDWKIYSVEFVAAKDIYPYGSSQPAGSDNVPDSLRFELKETNDVSISGIKIR